MQSCLWHPGTAERGCSNQLAQALPGHHWCCCWAVPAPRRGPCCQGSQPPRPCCSAHGAAALSLPLPTGTRPGRAGPRLPLRAQVCAGSSPCLQGPCSCGWWGSGVGPWLSSTTGSWAKGPGQGQGEDHDGAGSMTGPRARTPHPVQSARLGHTGAGLGAAARWGESRAEASLLLNPTAATKNSDTSAPKLLPGCTEGLTANLCDPRTWRSTPNQGRDRCLARDWHWHLPVGLGHRWQWHGTGGAGVLEGGTGMVGSG